MITTEQNTKTLPFDFSTWKLQLPTANSEQTNVDEVYPSSLAQGYSNKYFYRNTEGALVFYCPVDGFKTANTTYARSELRELIDGKTNAINWSLHGTHIFHTTEKVTQVPSNGRTITSQIHGVKVDGASGPVLIKVEYNGVNKEIAVRIKPSTVKNAEDERYFLKNIARGEIYHTTIKVVEGKLYVTVQAGEKVLHCAKDFQKADQSWQDYRFFYKVGNYVQDCHLDYEGENATVVVYNFDTFHSPEKETIKPEKITTQTEVIMHTGNEAQLTPLFTPFDTTDQSVVWNIERGKEIIALSRYGEIIARKEGTATIRATSVQNNALSCCSTITVTPEEIKQPVCILNEDFTSPLDSSWSLVNEGNCDVYLKENSLIIADRDSENEASATVHYNAIHTVATITFDLTVIEEEIKYQGTSRCQSSFYTIDFRGKDGLSLFSLRNKADLNAGKLLGDHVVLRRNSLDHCVNEEALFTPLGTTHTFTLIIRPDSKNCDANTTDVYLDGILVGKNMANNNKVQALQSVCFASDTQDLMTFSMKNLKIIKGLVLPLATKKMPLIVPPIPQYLKKGERYRIETNLTPPFVIEEGKERAIISDKGLLLAEKEGPVTIKIGTEKRKTTIVEQVIEPEALQIQSEIICVKQHQSLDVETISSILPSSSSNKELYLTVLSGKECVRLNKTRIEARKEGVATIQIETVSSSKRTKTLCLAITKERAEKSVIYQDNFESNAFHTDYWTIQTVNRTTVDWSSHHAMVINDESTAGQPLALLTFPPLDETFTVSYGFTLISDLPHRDQSSLTLCALGFGDVMKEANQGIRLTTKKEIKTSDNTIEKRQFSLNGLHVQEAAPVCLNHLYHIAIIMKKDKKSASFQPRVLIDGKESGERYSHITTPPVYNHLLFTAGVKDRAQFEISNLSITMGEG